jgi:hypothetical protein
MLLSLISSKITGRPMTVSHSLASGMLGKICITAMSTQALYRGHEDKRPPFSGPFLDRRAVPCNHRDTHYVWYLMEEVSEGEWDFRLHVMKIQDAASRVRLFKRMIADAANNQRAALQALRDKLAAMPLFQQRSAEQQKKCMEGRRFTLTACGLSSRV